MDLSDFVSKAIPHLVKGFLSDNLPSKAAGIISEHAKFAIAPALLGGIFPVVNTFATPTIITITVWHMYVELSDLLKVKFSENTIKSIAIGVVSNLSSYLAVSLGLNTALSFIPFVSSISGAAVTFISVAMSGIIYLEIIDKLFVSYGEIPEKSAEEIKRMADDIIQKADIDSMTKDLKEIYTQNENSIKEIAEK
ncbi:hypothetical protein [uncultured Campylobacter sp.]|uniref:hypothetical protein n=1 Tax=uncultured Campylobacter sp. TaxID=218934 RepID=UPI00262CEB53|nr:hypothetical protein [uncultured Campylobacter sp.]